MAEKKENQRVALTRRLLQEALLHLLEKKNIREVSVSELCAQAGINRSTFYKHYQIPEDVLRTITENLLEEFTASVLRGDGTYESDVEQLCISVKENEKLVRLLLKNNSSVDVTYYVNRFIEITGDRYKVYTQGYDEESLKLVTTFLLYGSTYAIEAWLHDGMKKTPREMAKIFCNLGMGGWLSRIYDDEGKRVKR